MVKLSPQSYALVGRLATPAPEKLGGRVEDKAKDFFREVWPHSIASVTCNLESSFSLEAETAILLSI